MTASSSPSTAFDSTTRQGEVRDLEVLPWTAVWTRSRHEQVVRDHLASRGIEVFLPTVARWSRRKDRRRKIDSPLFPGYCFVRVALQRRLAVIGCPGVVCLVSFDGQPAIIPDEEIEGIRRVVAAGVAYEQHPCIPEGTVARVMAGPLAGLVGRVIRKGSLTRLILSVELIHAAISVEVDALDVDRA